MRRASLLTVAALGLLVSLLGGSGLFAALTDTADLGGNNVDSAPMAGSADLKLAYLESPGTCGTYQDSILTGFISGSDFGPGSSVTESICLKNEGSQTVTVEVGTLALTDVDDSCTGDEAESGDLSCGGGALGELSSALYVQFTPTNCSGTAIGGSHESILSAFAGGSALNINFGLGSGSYLCYDVTVSEPSSFPSPIHQRAQSDSTSWTFQFTAVAVP